MKTHETTVSHADSPRGPLTPPPRIRRIIDHVVNADRHWFDAHPGATHRDRLYVPFEAWPKDPGDVDRVAVIRISATQQARCFYRSEEIA